MIAIGETLRRERLRRNLDLQQISDELKLSTRFLEAIESEQFDKLPGGVFTRSFVRQYARLLGLDGDEMAVEVARLVEPRTDTPPIGAKTLPSVSGFPHPPAVSWDRVSEGIRSGWPPWLPGLAMVVVMTLACSGVYVWWQRTQHPSARAAEPPAPPAQLAHASPPQATGPAPAPASPAEGASNPAVAQPLEPAANSAGHATPETAPPAPPAVAPAPTPAATAGPANLQRIESSTGAASGADSGAPLRVQLTAREPVWVRAFSNGKTLFTVTLAANETRTVDAKGSMELLLGNAGGIDILLNGKPIGAVGPKGQIRTVQLTSGGFKIVAPSKPAPTDPL
jgi:cytoskeleton protein RodZ